MRHVRFDDNPTIIEDNTTPFAAAQITQLRRKCILMVNYCLLAGINFITIVCAYFAVQIMHDLSVMIPRGKNELANTERGIQNACFNDEWAMHIARLCVSSLNHTGVSDMTTPSFGIVSPRFMMPAAYVDWVHGPIPRDVYESVVYVIPTWLTQAVSWANYLVCTPIQNMTQFVLHSFFGEMHTDKVPANGTFPIAVNIVSHNASRQELMRVMNEILRSFCALHRKDFQSGAKEFQYYFMLNEMRGSFFVLSIMIVVLCVFVFAIQGMERQQKQRRADVVVRRATHEPNVTPVVIEEALRPAR